MCHYLPSLPSLTISHLKDVDIEKRLLVPIAGEPERVLRATEVSPAKADTDTHFRHRLSGGGGTGGAG
jgi:hypothetical protein